MPTGTKKLPISLNVLVVFNMLIPLCTGDASVDDKVYFGDLSAIFNC